MLPKDNVRLRSLLLTVVLGLSPSAAVRARQQSPRPAPEKDDEVVRITTELVQTDVAVFDKQGRFVDGLRPEQFELWVNGKAQAITFFERVRAGSRSEGAQLAGASARIGRPNPSAPTAPTPRGGSSSFSLTTCI